MASGKRKKKRIGRCGSGPRDRKENGTCRGTILYLARKIDAFPRFYKHFFHISDASEPFPFEPEVVSMAKIFHEARFNRHLTNELARFVTGIYVCRRRAFSFMSKDGPLSLLSSALERLGDEPVQ